MHITISLVTTMTIVSCPFTVYLWEESGSVSFFLKWTCAVRSSVFFPVSVHCVSRCLTQAPVTLLSQGEWEILSCSPLPDVFSPKNSYFFAYPWGNLMSSSAIPNHKVESHSNPKKSPTSLWPIDHLLNLLFKVQNTILSSLSVSVHLIKAHERHCCLNVD